MWCTLRFYIRKSTLFVKTRNNSDTCATLQKLNLLFVFIMFMCSFIETIFIYIILLASVVVCNICYLYNFITYLIGNYFMIFFPQWYFRKKQNAQLCFLLVISTMRNSLNVSRLHVFDKPIAEFKNLPC